MIRIEPRTDFRKLQISHSHPPERMAGIILPHYPLTFEFEWRDPQDNSFSPTLFRLSEWNSFYPDVFLLRSNGDFYLMMTGCDPLPRFDGAMLLQNLDTGADPSVADQKLVRMCLIGQVPGPENLIPNWRYLGGVQTYRIRFRARLDPRPPLENDIIRETIGMEPNPHVNEQPLSSS